MIYPSSTLQVINTLIVTTIITFLASSANLDAQSNYTSNIGVSNLASAKYLNPMTDDSSTKTTPIDNNEEALSRIATFGSNEMELSAYLNKNIVYPEIALENTLEGSTIIRFKVMPDGALDQFTVKQSTHKICDQAVISALQNMPNWTPARFNGNKVAMWREVAVNFSLSAF